MSLFLHVVLLLETTLYYSRNIFQSVQIKENEVFGTGGTYGEEKFG